MQDSNPLQCIDLVGAKVQPEMPKEPGGRFIFHIKNKNTSKEMLEHLHKGTF